MQQYEDDALKLELDKIESMGLKLFGNRLGKGALNFKNGLRR